MSSEKGAVKVDLLRKRWHVPCGPLASMRIRELFSRIPYRFGVTRAHGSSPGVHVASRSRWSYGRAFLAVLLLARVFSFSIGCGPADGSLGGKCTTHTDGCTGRVESNYCNDGVCNEITNICEAAPPATPAPPPTPSCTAAGRGTCPADQISFACSGDASPEPYGIECALSPSAGPGDAEYCCTPSASNCVALTSPCSAPSQYFSCSYGVTPSVAEADASLRCALLPPDQLNGYCCASGDVCFSVPPTYEDWCGSRPAYFCPGSTPPDAGNCERMDALPESNGLEAYCCDAPDVLDAGGD
jgi:hypothetical protein